MDWEPFKLKEKNKFNGESIDEIIRIRQVKLGLKDNIFKKKWKDFNIDSRNRIKFLKPAKIKCTKTDP